MTTKCSWCTHKTPYEIQVVPARPWISFASVLAVAIKLHTKYKQSQPGPIINYLETRPTVNSNAANKNFNKQ